MAGKGGYQRPTTPAQVSGPGKYSQRTDGKPSADNMKQTAMYLSGEPYGENADLNAMAQAAPMSAGVGAGNTPQMAPAPARPAPQSLTPFLAPTERPEEPLTAGNPYGPGPGPEALSTSQGRSPEETQRLYAIYAILSAAAERSDATDATRNLVRQLQGLL